MAALRHGAHRHSPAQGSVIGGGRRTAVRRIAVDKQVNPRVCPGLGATHADGDRSIRSHRVAAYEILHLERAYQE